MPRPKRPTHVCPPGDCAVQVTYDSLMCGEHTAMVPEALLTALGAAWLHGSPREYFLAARAAIKAVEEQMGAEVTG
jgi:hypothetical protein